MGDPSGGRLFLERLTPAAAVLALGGVLSMLASRFIDARFPGRPMPRDLLLDALPALTPAQYVADLTVICAVAILFVFYSRRHPHDIPEATAIFGLMYLLRSAIIVLTPLASPHGNGSYGILPPQTGMFPSGHMANVLLGWLLVRRYGGSKTSLVLGTLAIVEGASLLLSRGHYSIDLVGGMLLTYFVYMEWTRGSIFDPLKRSLV